MPKWSGVIFTENPEDSQQMVIEYSDQAHAVTDATVVPKRLELDRHNPRILPNQPEFLKELLDCAQKIEKVFNVPQDIEWVYDGKLWIVQARPITTRISQQPLKSTVDPIRAELDRLTKQFGQYAPRLSAQQFSESLGNATPITQSLFQQFFSERGSWGRFLRQYHIPHRHYEVETYLPTIFNRLYVNKNEEQRILYQVVDDTTSLTNNPTPHFTKPPDFLRSLQHPLLSLRQVISATRLRTSTYYQYRRLDISITQSPLPVDGTPEALKSIRTRLVDETVPRLFQVSAYQDYCLQVLQKHLSSQIESTLWEQLLRPLNPGLVTETLQKNPGQANLIEQLGHRGPREFELAEPRWAEDPAGLLIMSTQSDSFKSKPQEDIKALRQSIINRFASAWDQQMVETHFMLYDYYYACRDRAHDEWIRELTAMRRVLLQLDEAEALHGLIWYTSLEDIFDHYPKLDIPKLERRRAQHREFVAHDLPTEIDGEEWSSLVLTKENVSLGIGSYPAQRLVRGTARGVTGTLKDLKNGKQIQILVVTSLDPGLVIYFNQICGIITEGGGLLSHGTILARELGIATVSLSRATHIIPMGVQVSLNANQEQITII